jgi:SAM-dependent methyltransferase
MSASMWELGRYERTAQTLLPAAAAVLEAAAPLQGARLLDVGCGTGNAALLAAGAGAEVIGVDPADRLLEVARDDALQRGLVATFVRGTAGELPLADASADAVVSVFGVIFAPDPGAAAAEMARVTVPEGRIAISAWLPRGPIFQILRLRAQVVSELTGEPPAAPPFPWHDRAALSELLASHGFAVSLTEHELPFTADSPHGWIDAELAEHPLWVSARQTLPHEALQRIRDGAVEILAAANEDPDGFRMTSSYVVAVACRG